MSRISRLAVLATALTSLFAVMSSSAGAVTWTNTGATAVHMTGLGGTLHVGVGHAVCSGATATGTAPASTSGGYVIHGTILFTPCNIAGQNTYISCGYGFTASAHTGGNFGGATAGTLSVACDARLEAGGVGLCYIHGTAPGVYNNPLAAGGTGTLTLPQSAALTVTNFSSTSCPLGTGTGTLTHQSLTTTAFTTPILNTDP